MLMKAQSGEPSKWLKRIPFSLVFGERPFRFLTGTPTNKRGFFDIPQSLEENRGVFSKISP